MTTTPRADLEAFWMPFTANRQFKSHPRLLARAEGMHYWTDDGRKMLDGVAGLWCVNAGHGRKEITEAVSKQLATMDYAPPFQMGHPPASSWRTGCQAHARRSRSRVLHQLRLRVGRHRAEDRDRVSPRARRSRAPAPHRTREGLSRRRLRRHLGRRHGQQSQVLRHACCRASIICAHTHDIEHNAFSRGLPEQGAHLADDLERLVALHDASTIAAVIVEPIAGSAGVLLPPKGYLQRLREICDKHGILLIFDEVITGFGRLGAPFARAVLRRDCRT